MCVDNIFNGVLINFLFFIHLLFLEDKQTGWSPTSDNRGWVFVKIRNWSKVYDELEISFYAFLTSTSAVLMEIIKWQSFVESTGTKHC